MKKKGNPISDTIMKEYKLKKKYAEFKKRDITLAQFQLKHCRYCKNQKTNLCEIRKNIFNELCCAYEENFYERRNIK